MTADVEIKRVFRDVYTVLVMGIAGTMMKNTVFDRNPKRKQLARFQVRCHEMTAIK
jgi:hypothetical protein